MPVVDHEAAWIGLKALLSEKRSWGADEILIRMSQLEVHHRLPEGQEGYDDRPLPLHLQESSAKPAGDHPLPLAG